VSSAVIVAHHDDIHVHAVKLALEDLGCLGFVLDIEDFTNVFDLISTIDADRFTLKVVSESLGRSLELDEISGLWWRRPYPPLSKYRRDKPHNLFAVVKDESRSALIGCLCAMVQNSFNDLGRSRQAAYKPTQLVRAQKLGLKVPKTLITNDPEEVRAFHNHIGRNTVYKMFNGSPFGLYGTRRLEEEDLDSLDRLKGCPAIFQEYIDGDYDIRVTIVGDQVFSARIDYGTLDEVIDTRFVETGISECKLPCWLEERLVQLVSDFGLVYGAIDLRFSAANGYVFFELNPEGQYLWIEIETGLPISRAIAKHLIG
jgi:RimK-like ATP-grasp domain